MMLICSKFNLQFLSVAAHSWLACSDYGEKNAAYYDHSKCRGWPRKAAQYAPNGKPFTSLMFFDFNSLYLYAQLMSFPATPGEN